MKFCLALCLIVALASVGHSDDPIVKQKRLFVEIFNFLGELAGWAAGLLDAGLYLAFDLAHTIVSIPLDLAKAALNAVLDITKGLTYGCRLINSRDSDLGGGRYKIVYTLERTTCSRDAGANLSNADLCPKAPGSDIVCTVIMKKGNILNLYKPVVESKTCVEQ